MKQNAKIAVVVGLLASPVAADEKGFSLMEEGAKLFFKGIIQEMEPAMDDLQSFADQLEPSVKQFVEQMGPALGELMGKIDDINAYHPPEILPNGDIILRKKKSEERAEPDETEI